jgi:hypothetical protein
LTELWRWCRYLDRYSLQSRLFLVTHFAPMSVGRCEGALGWPRPQLFHLPESVIEDTCHCVEARHTRPCSIGGGCRGTAGAYAEGKHCSCDNYVVHVWKAEEQASVAYLHPFVAGTWRSWCDCPIAARDRGRRLALPGVVEGGSAGQYGVQRGMKPESVIFFSCSSNKIR